MTKLSSALSLICLSLIGAATLPAQAAPATPSDSAVGPYIGGAIGRSSFGTHDLSVPRVGGDEHDTAGKIYGGYRLNENFGFEAGYARLGSFNERITLGTGTVDQGAKARSFYGAVTGRLPLNDTFALNGRLGVSFGKVSGANLLPAGSSLNGSVRSSMLGIGAEYQIAPKLVLTADYDHFGRVSDKVSANLLSVGVRFSF